MKSRLPLLIAVLATVLAAWIVAARVRIDPDVAALLPESGEGAALRQYVRAFGGGDLGLVLLRGQGPDEVRQAAFEATDALRSCPGVRAAMHQLHGSPSSDPSVAWAFADANARRELQQALTPAGMKARLDDTRALLLGPGSGALSQEVALDPLRLREIPLQARSSVAAGASASGHGWMASGGGAFTADQGRARLVLFAPEGQALRGQDAHAVTLSVAQCLDPVRRAHAGVTIDVTGGHAIAAASEDMIRRDLQWSGTLSMLLASLVFALTFRRLRALLAVMPPLALGTLWAAALGGVAFGRLSAISTAFVAVVVGVGVDTGVHVYAALLDARRRGLPAREAAHDAWRSTWRPTMVAALTAAAAFGSLALSSIRALQQLGVLCALGEVLTAIAILLVTPTIGAWLERGPPPPATQPWWTGPLHRAARSPASVVVLAVAIALPSAAIAYFGPPRMNDALVAIRPSSLAPVRTLDDAFTLFGGESRQWVVLVSDTDLERAREKADTLFERLSSSPEALRDFDGLARFAPCVQTQRLRLAERNALDLPGREGALRSALEAAGFAPAKFDAAYAWMRAPSPQVRDVLDGASDQARLLRARFIGQDADRWLVATYVRPEPGHEREVEALVASADPSAVITGYARLDSALRAALVRDLPRVGLVAAFLVLLTMAAALRRAREVGIAVATLAFELVWVLAIVRWAGLRLHAYDVMVLPVLLGVTVDEAMFLLHRARTHGMAESLRHEGPSVVATATTTAAGFGALLVCRYDALADMGWMGLVGVLVGLAAALVVVPVLGTKRRQSAATP